MENNMVLKCNILPELKESVVHLQHRVNYEWVFGKITEMCFSCVLVVLQKYKFV